MVVRNGRRPTNLRISRPPTSHEVVQGVAYLGPNSDQSGGVAMYDSMLLNTSAAKLVKL